MMIVIIIYIDIASHCIPEGVGRSKDTKSYI